MAEQIDPNAVMPVRIVDLVRIKGYLLTGGTHAEGQALCELIDARFDHWQLQQKLAAASTPDVGNGHAELPAPTPVVEARRKTPANRRH